MSAMPWYTSFHEWAFSVCRLLMINSLIYDVLLVEYLRLYEFLIETVEESSSSRSLYDGELKRLQNYIQQLQNEIWSLKQEKQQSPHHTTSVCTFFHILKL